MKAFLTALVACFSLTAAIEPVLAGETKKDPPTKLELFSKEDWYKDQKGDEKEWIGVLGKVEKKGGIGIGFQRHNPYYLTMAKDQKPPVREVYVGGKLEILMPYVGKKVKLVGKAVDFEKLEGRDHHEIWPARLEVLGDGKDKDGDKDKSSDKDKGVDGGKTEANRELKVFATTTWPWTTANPDDMQKPIQLVVRSAAELVAAGPFANRDAPPQAVEKEAAALLAQAFKVESIDWNKQMIVVVSTGTLGSGGIRIDVVNVKSTDGKVVVTWKTNNPQVVTNAFTHPSQAVLVEKAAGKAEFVAQKEGKLRPRPIREPGAKKSPTNPFLTSQETAVTGGEKDEIKIIAKFPARAAGTTSVVIKSGEELAKLTSAKDADEASADLAKKLKVEKIDWTKQMVVVVSGGPQRTGGYSVDVKGLSVKDKTLTVQWKLNSPAPDSIVTQAFTHPGATILIDRFEGNVQFDPAPPKGKGLDRD